MWAAVEFALLRLEQRDLSSKINTSWTADHQRKFAEELQERNRHLDLRVPAPEPPESRKGRDR
jgi:hypothetical protein